MRQYHHHCHNHQNKLRVKPEALPPAEDIKKVQRQLDGDEKKLLKDVKNKKGSS